MTSMTQYRELFVFIAEFLVIALAANLYVPNLIPAAALEHVRVVEQMSLAMLAVAADRKLYLQEMRGSLRSFTAIED